MSRFRISMHDIRTLLRHYYGEQSSKREVARLLRLSPGTVRNYLRRATAAGLRWPLPESLTDAELEALLFPHSGPISSRPQPDWREVHQELSRKGMTLERIWVRQANWRKCSGCKSCNMKHNQCTYFHEPCGYPCEGIREASVVVRVAGAIEQRNSCHLGRRGCHRGRRQHARYCYGEVFCGPTVSKTPRTHVRISPGPGRPLSCPELIGTAWGRRKTLKPTMYEIEESDEGIVGFMKSWARESSLTLHSFRPTRSWKTFSTWGWMPTLALVF